MQVLGYPEVKALTDIIEMTGRVIRLSSSTFDNAQKTRVEQALLAAEGQCLIAKTLMERIQGEVDVRRAIYGDLVKKRQQAAVKLLTWIACIFLPLSTASSILSMSSRAKDIGSVWWDWLSIVVITGLVVLLGYTWAMKSFVFTRSLQFSYLRMLVTESKKDTLKDHKRRHLVHPAVAILVFLSICAFTVGTVTALLMGMFMSLETGAKVLGLSVAGAVGLTVVPLFIWRIFNLYRWLARCIKSKSWIWPVRLSEEPISEPTSLPEKRGSDTLGSFTTVALLCLVLPPILFASLFTGSLIFELLSNMYHNAQKWRTDKVAEKKSENGQGKRKSEKGQGKMNMTEDINRKEEDEDIEQEAGASGP